MAKQWNYAELAKAAKKCGGPEQLIKNLRHGGAIEALTIGIPVTATISIVLKIAWDKYRERVRYKTKKSETILKENLENELVKEDEDNEQISEC